MLKFKKTSSFSQNLFIESRILNADSLIGQIQIHMCSNPNLRGETERTYVKDKPPLKYLREYGKLVAQPTVINIKMEIYDFLSMDIKNSYFTLLFRWFDFN